MLQNPAGEPRCPPAGTTSAVSGLHRFENAEPESITVILSRIKSGDRGAFDRLVPLVYQELHKIAEAYLRRELQNHTLQPTALINEAYLRLAMYGGSDYENRTHFFAVAARVMRRFSWTTPERGRPPRAVRT